MKKWRDDFLLLLAAFCFDNLDQRNGKKNFGCFGLNQIFKEIEIREMREEREREISMIVIHIH